MSKELFLDFEFSEVTEEKVKLVCCSTITSGGYTIEWWLHKDPEKQKELKKYLRGFDVFISYSAIAEARSFYSLDLNPLSYEWIDLFLEYRCLTNHNDDLAYGDQLVDGKVVAKFKPKPKWERTEEDSKSGFKPTHSLAEATFKLLGTIRDTEHKEKMRKLIISNPASYSPEDRLAIMAYCTEDVKDLKPMFIKVKEKYKELDYKIEGEETLISEMKLRGRFSALTSIMESKGYPIDIKKTKNFSKHVGNILFDCQREINNLFPEIRPFRWNKKNQKYTWDQNATRDWVEKNHDVNGWMKTDTGNISLALEAFTRFYDFKHDYPTDNFGAQMVRYLKLKQTLYGFVPSPDKEKKTFWHSVGSDGRVRPYTNIYGAQSSRSQPSSTGFMFLKPAWMRALVQPAEGKAMAGIDYGSQEFFLSALLSSDDEMIDAYLSGDPYFAFAKKSGAVPADAKKEDHKAVRDLFKATVLGISYLMTKYGLAIKLTSDTGQVWTEDGAQDQIDLFYSTFPCLKEYQNWLLDIYKEDKYLKLPCGWYMWGDNPNFRSASNMPIQGFGASVLRKAVDLAFERGLYVPFTLHDAVYIEYNVGEEYKIKILADCMREAFVHYLEEDKKEFGSKIKLDPFAWSPNYEKDSEIEVEGMKIPISNLYIDSRSEKDYLAFSKYFEDESGDLL